MTAQEAAATVGKAVMGLGRGARGGCGIVVAQDRVLTLAHHLRGEEVEVRAGEEARVTGTVVATDPDLDLAVLDVETGAVAPVRWADGDPPALGAPVWALGDPGGAGLRVTQGAISTGPLRVRGRRGRPVEGMLEHTAPLPRGSGGGPLLGEDGAVLGLNALRQPGGFVLALPAAAIAPRLEALLEGRAAPGRRLGVAVLPPRAARRLRRSVGLPDAEGLLVRGVAGDSPAARAGLARGDLITALDGRPVSGIDDLYAALDQAPAGTPVTVRALRGTEEVRLDVVLGGDEVAS